MFPEFPFFFLNSKHHITETGVVILQLTFALERKAMQNLLVKKIDIGGDSWGG